MHSQVGGLGGGGVLQISSGGDDRRIFLGLKFLIAGFFWVLPILGRTLLRIFWGINSNNLNINCGSANVSRKLRLINLT